MDGKQLRRLRPELEVFLDRYFPLFGRSENGGHAERFVQGLLGGSERRNTENVAEAVAGGVVRTMQKFVAQGCWESADVLGELRMHVSKVLGDSEGTINVDETGFAKKGTKSVGVKRQSLNKYPFAGSEATVCMVTVPRSFKACVNSVSGMSWILHQRLGFGSVSRECGRQVVVQLAVDALARVPKPSKSRSRSARRSLNCLSRTSGVSQFPKAARARWSTNMQK